MAQVILGVTCKQCGRRVNDSIKWNQGDDARGYLCEVCIVDNAVAYDALIQQIATGYATDYGQRCQACNRTLDEIEALTGKRSMIVHMRDGVNQMLCRRCSDKYELKATTLYHNTLYGWLKKLRGNK